MRTIAQFIGRIVETIKVAARPEAEQDSFEQLASDELRRRFGRAPVGAEGRRRRTYYSRHHPSHRQSGRSRPEHVEPPRRLDGG